jgi:hypothetical protein
MKASQLIGANARLAVASAVWVGTESPTRLILDAAKVLAYAHSIESSSIREAG